MMSQKFLYPILISLILIVFVASAFGQTQTQYDKGTPPQHTTGVSSFGSYSSTELGTVNLGNGSLNFKLPLGSVGGRGFSVPLTLNYSSKVWSGSKDTDTDQTGAEKAVAFADYDRGSDWVGWFQFISAGWSIGAAPELIDRRVQVQKITGGGCVNGYSYLLNKLTLRMPDGGEVEFRDDLYDGAPLPASNCGSSAASRGTRWHATDGSGMVFINDVNNGVASFPTPNLSGVVVTRDGTRYRFGAGGLCTSITDRNGNKITIEYFTPTEVRYTDQLGRVTSIKQNVVDPDNPSVTLAMLVTLPGYQGTPRYFKIKTGVMNANYRSGINPSLPVITGDWDPLSKGYAWPLPRTILFIKSYGLYAQRIDDLDVLTEVVLPDNRSLNFRYNQHGEVAEVTLPTGGKFQYDYGYDPELPSGNSPVWQTNGEGITSDVKQVDRVVTERRTYPDGVNLEGKWNYLYGPQLVSGVNHPCTQVQARNSSNTLLLDQRHFFLSAQQYTEAPVSGGHDGTFYAKWSTGVEWRTETRDAAGVVLSASEQDWTQRAAVSWSTYAQEQPANDNRVNQTREYLETGMMSKVETLYDQYNNPTEVKEYDYDQTLKRRTVTTYLSTANGFNYQTDDSIHLLSLEETETVYDGSGNQKARSVTEYDSYVNDGDRALLTGYASVSQHDSNYGTTKITRGNPTRNGQWLNTTAATIYSYPRYDIAGNVVSLKDEGGSVSTVSFTDDFGGGSNPGTPTQNPTTPTYAFATLFTSPPPLPGAPVHTARSQYDYSSGLLTGFRDRNNIVTQTIYNDPFNRPTQVKSALGVSGVETHVAMHYAPATVFGITLTKNDVLTASDLNTLDDGSIRSWTVTDGFGRTTEAWKRDPVSNVKVVTIYDGLGRVKQTSNPFRPATESAVYTTTGYDLAGRVTSVTTPDNATVTTSYSANTITVTDQAGKIKKSVNDALERLIEVREDPNGLNYQTVYTYDALDSLVKVTQGTQQRFFMYDSLKRLIRARNPEQATHAGLNLSDPVTGNSTWSFGYQYDVSGNLTQKTDPRGVVTNLAYDAFDRSTTIDYSDTPAINPDVKWFYDGATNGKGRFWHFYKGGDASVGSNVDHTATDSYDALGRPLVRRQLFKLNGAWGPTYQTSRAYNRAGGVTSQTYPSGRTVSYTYDVAGRTSNFTGNLGDGANRTYSTNIEYAPFGGLNREQFGTTTALYHKLFYNIRGQLFDTRVSSVNDLWDWNRGRLILYYSSNHLWGQSGTDNNGNVRFAETWIPPENATLDQADTLSEDSYSYDALNRLTSVVEQRMSVASGWGVWQQQFRQQYNYDRYGNRTLDAAQTWGTGINNKVFSVDPATNRLAVPSGQPGVMTYDNAGNLTTDTYSGAGTRTYDADNRMTTAADNTGQISRYTYDADGNRVRVQIASSQEKWHVYGFDNELLAEYRANATAASPEKEYAYRNGELLVSATGRFNVALASNGAVATASSTATGSGFSTTGAINGNNRGPWGNSLEGWNDNTPGVLPDWIQVDFAGSKTIDEISVFSLHDNYIQENTPTETQTFTLYGLQAFTVQYWDGSAWTTIPSGNVTGNNKVWRKFTFSPITTSKIRVTINQVPDSWSRVVEIQAFGTSAGGEKVQWLVADHLGSPRIVLDQAGSLVNVKRHDYLPFGEELFAGIGGRTVAQGYSADGIRQQFTSKERDSETNLDYFLARYYSSIQGRFSSPDEFSGGPDEYYDFKDLAAENPTFYADLTDPQSLNKYQYAYNNPLLYIDPNGHQGVREWFRNAANKAADFAEGVGRGISSSVSFGASGAPRANDSLVNRAGQGVGTVATAVAGYKLYQAGVGATVLSGGSLAKVGIGVAVVGTATVAGATVNAVRIATTPMQRNTSGSGGGSTLHPGPNAGESIPARGPQRDFTPAERNAVNKAGRKTGCHTCGSTKPGTKSGNFVPDHQPPTGTNKTNSPQRLYPHCQNCSRKQGGQVRAAKAKNRKE